MTRIPLASLLGLLAFLFGCAATGSGAPTATIPVPTAATLGLDDLRNRLASSEVITRLDAIDRLERDASPAAVRILGDFLLDSDA